MDGIQMKVTRGSSQSLVPQPFSLFPGLNVAEFSGPLGFFEAHFFKALTLLLTLREVAQGVSVTSVKSASHTWSSSPLCTFFH